MTRPLSFDELSKLSFEYRRRWGIKAPRPDLLNIIRREFPKEFPRFRLAIIPDETPHEVIAFCDRATDTIGIRQYVEDRNDVGDDRAMNILGEEIAHFVLRHPGRRFRKTDDLRARRFENVSLEEREAKLFYAMLLAPVALAENCGSAPDLTKKYGLEPETAGLYFEELARRQRLLSSHKSRELILPGSLRKEPKLQNEAAKQRFEFPAPKKGLIAVVSIEMDSAKSRCVINAPGEDGGFISFDYVGEKNTFKFPSSRNEMFVREVGNASVRVRLLRWHDPITNKQWDGDLKGDPSIARSFGFSGEKCPDCSGTDVSRDGNCLTCKGCGWTSSPD